MDHLAHETVLLYVVLSLIRTQHTLVMLSVACNTGYTCCFHQHGSGHVQGILLLQCIDTQLFMTVDSIVSVVSTKRMDAADAASTASDEHLSEA